MSSFAQNLLGLKPSTQLLLDYINALDSAAGLSSSSTPEVKAYPDVVYFNFHSLGLSFLFKPFDGYKPKMGLTRPELMDDKLVLESIDFYNIPKVDASDPKSRSGSKKKAETAFATHPVSPIALRLAAQPESTPSELKVSREMIGKDFVQQLGEPDRKGGGSGPSSGSIGIWCEWSKHGLLVEFGGVEATGPQAWERGKDAGWRVITVFSPDTK